MRGLLQAGVSRHTRRVEPNFSVSDRFQRLTLVFNSRAQYWHAHPLCYLSESLVETAIRVVDAGFDLFG